MRTCNFQVTSHSRLQGIVKLSLKLQIPVFWQQFSDYTVMITLKVASKRPYATKNRSLSLLRGAERVWDIQNEQKAPKSLGISDAKLIKTNTFLNCTTISSVCLNTTLNYSRPWQESIMVHIYLGENKDVLLLLIIEKRRFTVLVWNIVVFVKCISPYLASVLLGQCSQIRIVYM